MFNYTGKLQNLKS